MVHSRWLTLACRVLRYYVSFSSPSRNLKTLAEFCIKVYFPSWFDIKANHAISSGANNFFNMVQRVQKFPVSKVKKWATESLQRNAFFAHPENILLAMLCDSDEAVRRIGVNKVLSIRGKMNFDYQINFNGGFVDQDDEADEADQRRPSPVSSSSVAVRKFRLPKLNLKARAYHQLVNLNDASIGEPPAIRNKTDDEIERARVTPLVFLNPCHNQQVERHVKLVTEASGSVVGYARRDGLIRQRIRSRKLMKSFTSKNQYVQ